jgi:hypothetical protein
LPRIAAAEYDLRTTDLPLPRATFRVSTVEQDDVPATGFREGLPETYRSRQDMYYVEELTASAESQPLRLLALTRIDARRLPTNEPSATWRDQSTILLDRHAVTSPVSADSSAATDRRSQPATRGRDRAAHSSTSHDR